MNQHDCDYPVIQNAVTHTERLWQTLDQNKLYQKLKKARKRTNQCHHNKNSNQQTDSQDNLSQSSHQSEEQQDP